MQIHAQMISDENDNLLLKVFFEVCDQATDQIIEGSSRIYERRTELSFTENKCQFLKLC